MPPAWIATEYKERSGIINTNKAKQLFGMLCVGEEITLSVLVIDNEDPALGAKKRKRIAQVCEVMQISKYCLFVRWNNQIKCVTEADIITGECQIWRNDDEIIDN